LAELSKNAILSVLETLYLPNSSTLTYEARNFSFADGINEDPVCGSEPGAVASILAENGDAMGNFTINQGSKIRRDDKTNVEVKVGRGASKGIFNIHVCGKTITCINES